MKFWAIGLDCSYVYERSYVMCTSLKYKSCFGRNFDYEVSYEEQLINIPTGSFGNEYAIIGMCTGLEMDYPLLYDGMNEYGLCCSGLAFTGNAHYEKIDDVPYGDYVIPPYDFVFRILGHFKSVKEVREHLGNAHIIDETYSADFPNNDLHWHIVDSEDSIIVEQTIDGLKVYDGDVLTNNPPYPLQLEYNEWSISFVGYYRKKDKEHFTRGTETEMLDGGYTSSERFTRVSYLKKQLESSNSDFNPITETFHLLQSVEQIYGATPVEEKFEYTIYSIVYDISKKAVWLKTYDKLCPLNFIMGNELERVDIV